MSNPEFDFGNMATMNKTTLKLILKCNQNGRDYVENACKEALKNIERLEAEYGIESKTEKEV
jgi:hypothetical protein